MLDDIQECKDGIDSSKDSGKLMISVLSAVAEIERENIRTQTMAGREQKAREGKWNGGFAPYGYKLENGELLIAEDEVEVVKLIYDRYIHTNDGINGVAKYLNDHGYTKKVRQNGTIPGFSSHFVKDALDNLVYMGNIAKAHSKDKKTRYYYYCKNTLGATGHKCTFRLNIEQTEMNRMVAAIISAMAKNPRFSDAIKAKIGSAVDTADMEKQLETLQTQLRQALGTKSRLERQMDNLDINDPYYDRKILDLQRRYDEQYGKIEEVEIQIDGVQAQICSIRQEKISGDNIYQLLLEFDEVYGVAIEVEQKEFMRAFIERIDLYPEK